MYELAGFSEFLETYFPKVSNSREFAKSKILGTKDYSKCSFGVNLYNRGYTFCYWYLGSTSNNYAYAFRVFTPIYYIDTDRDSILLEQEQKKVIDIDGIYRSSYNDFTLSLDRGYLSSKISDKLGRLLKSAYVVNTNSELRLLISERSKVISRKVYEYCFYILRGNTVLYCFALHSYDKAIDKVKKDDVIITELENGYNFDIRINLDGKSMDLLFSIDRIINNDSFELLDIR